MNKQHIAGSRVSAAAFRRRSALMLSAGAASLLLACPALAQDLPVDGVVAGGSATITTPTATSMRIEQTSDRAVIDWTSFDIATGHSVDFDQPSHTAITLNRVTGGDPTDIHGILVADGIVGILNPNGVYFDGTAFVDVGGMIATTGDLVDQANFLTGGALAFTGGPAGSTVSVGVGTNITVNHSGLAAFVAPHVVNRGLINATAGKVVLAAGDTFTLDLAGDGLLALGVSSDDPLVENYGDIFAYGGTITLSAQAATTVVDDVINAGGVMSIDDVYAEDGAIVLAANGGVNVTADLRGGDVTITGRRIHGAPLSMITDGTLTLNVNAEGADTTGETLIADALGVIGTVAGGTTLNLGDGLYASGATINKANVTLDGGGVATIAAQLNGEDGIIVGGNGDGATITGLNILGAADQSYVTYAWGGDITRGVRILNGAENVTVVNNVITGVRNGVLIDGRNTGSQIVNNVIDNTKSGISVQYTDGSDLVIAGNQEGAFGNEWGINVHLNGIWNGATITGSAGALGPNTPLVEQQRLLALRQANNGMSVQNQAWSASNRTHVYVATTGAAANQGSLLSPIDTIQGGVNAVVTGGWITVADGTYTQASTLNVNKALTLRSINRYGAVIDASSMPVTPLGRIVNVIGDDVVIDGFTINGPGTHVGISIPGQGVTISNNAINNVLTGVQTNTAHAVGNAIITDNTITGSTVGVSLQNTGNIVSGNMVMASTEGVGLLVSNNLIVNNAFNIGVGGDALNFYGAATATGLTTANNIVSIQGGGLQNAVYLAGAGGTVNVGDGTYNENILINAPDMTLRSVNQYGAVIDAGGTGSGISISSVNGSLGDITIDGFTVQNWNVGGIVQGMAAAPFAAVHVLNNNIIGPVGGSTNHGNGIQVSGDGSTVIGNTVSGAILNSADWSGSGILVVNGSNILVEGNQVSGSDLGIAVANWNNVGGMSGITVRNNMISDSAEGISVQAFAGQQWTPSGPISSVEITGNTITDSESGLGVWDYTPSLDAIWASTVTDISGNTFERNQSHVSSNFADADVLSLLGANTFDRTIHATGGSAIYGDLAFAVSDATAGSTLNLSADVFNSAILIDKDLTLLGAGVGQTIIRPDSPLATGVGHKYTANMNAVVFVNGASNVVLDGLTIDGNGLNNDAAVFWNNASGEIRNAHITNVRPFSGVQTGQGLAVDATGGNTVNLTVSDVVFDNWNKNAIDVVTGQGAMAGGGDVNLTVENSTFTGRGATGTIAQNGIVLWERAGGTINASIGGSTFSGIEYADPSWTAAGVLVYGSPNGQTSISYSSFAGVQQYIALSAGSVNGLDATVGNTFDGVAADSATLAELFAIEDRIIHGVDEAGNGLVRIRNGNVYVTPASGNLSRGVALASIGDTVNVSDGTHTLANTLNINKALTLRGQSQAGTLIDASGNASYGLYVSGDNVTLEQFTLQGPAADTYGIHVSPGGAASNRVTDFTIGDVTIQGSGRTELDLNGVNGAVIDTVTADGQNTEGNGISLTDSANVTVANSTTLNNNWGGLALYQRNAYYDQQLRNIAVDASNNFGEANPVYAQMYFSAAHEPEDITVEGFDFIAGNNNQGGTAYIWFRRTVQDAIDTAVNVPNLNDSIVGGWTGTDFDGNYYVGVGNLLLGGTQAMSIQTAVNEAEAGNTINVLAGTYAGFGTQFGGPAGLNILGNGAVIDATGTPATPILRIVDLRADGTTFSGFTINGDGNHVGVSVSGRGVTVSNNTINNVLTGVQTTTQYVDGNGFITGNTIVADYGVSVQNGGNTVTGNTVTAENMGFGLRRKTGVGLAAVNTVSGNIFTVGAGGEALSLVEDATVADDLNASDNTVSIAGGGLQGAFDLAGDNGDLTVGAATYAENVASNNANMTLAFNGATVDSLALTGAGTQISGNLTGVGNLSFADLTLLGALTLASQTGNVTTGAVGGAHALSATANAGTVTFAALNVGSVTASGANIVTAGATTTGAQSYTGATTLDGAYTTGGGAFTVNGASTLAGATNVATGGGNATLGSVTGPFAFTAAAGAGDVTLGAVDVASLTASGANIVTAGAVTNGAQSYTGATTLNGAYTTGGGAFTVNGATTLAGATNVATGGGNATFGAVNGAAPGAQAFTANAGAGSVSLGSVGATARLGAVQVVSADTVLNGDIYAGNSLNFDGGAVRLTAALTTFDSRTAPAAGGDITFASDIVGTANGAQNVAFIAGSGASLASDGDITLANAGTDAVRLGAMTATGGDFSAQTVKLAGDFTSTLSGDQVFSANTLDTQGGVNSQVGGNASGPIIAGQGVIITAGGDIISSPITAGGSVVLTAGGQIVSTITTPGSITLTAQQGLDVQLTGGAVFVSAPNGVVNGVFTTISTDGNGSYVINGQRQVGDPTDPRQILIDAFITPAGGVVGPTGVIELPAGLALGLIAPAGEGEGQRPAILVNDVARLGELLRLGYTAIIIQIDESGLIIEEELLLAEAAE